MQAKWIWQNEYQCPNVYLNFYDTLLVENTADSYRIRISADSQYALYINGTFFQFGQFADYPDYKVYDEFEITSALERGENTIVIVGYCQFEDSFTYRKAPCGLFYEVSQKGEIVCCSSEQTMVCVNSAFRHDGVEKITGQLGFSFYYDSRKENDQIGLKNADIQEKSMTLFPRPVEKLDILPQKKARILTHGIFQEPKTASVIGMRMQYAAMAFRDTALNQFVPSEKGIRFEQELDGKDGIFVILDLEEETTGICNLVLDVPCDCEILIGYGEHLEDMRVRSYVGTRNFCASYYAKKGRNEFLNPFRRFGLRYLQLHVYAPNVTLYYAGVQPTLYPISTKAYFHCADQLHNKIYEICVRTLHMCMHEHYEDCPWREQALYSMDSRNQMLCGYYALGEYPFAKASLRLMALSIREDSMLEICSPARGSITIPSFTAIYVTQLYEYLLHSGDKEFVREMLPVAKKIADECIRRQNANHLMECFPETEYWNFYEWQTGLDGVIGGFVKEEDMTEDAPLNAFASMAFHSLSEMCRILELPEQATYYAEAAVTLNQAMDVAFWQPEKKIYASYRNRKGELSHDCELTQALFAYSGACPDEKLDGVLQALTSHTLLPITLSYSIFKYDALMKKPEKYGKWVCNEIAELWGYMLYHGATTFWETIDGADAFGYGGSLCHGWSAIPIYFYFRYALGMTVDPNATTQYTIQPSSSGLYECEGKIETPTQEWAVTL